MLTEFKTTATSVRVIQNTRVYAETSSIFTLLSLYCRQLVLDAVVSSVSIQEVGPTHYHTCY